MNPLCSNSFKSLLTAAAFSWLSQHSLHAADVPVLPTGQVGNTAVQNEAKDASMVDGINVQPFWKSGEMTGEPVLFIQQAGAKTASGKLIFTPTANLEIKNPDGSLQYELGKDYRWAPGSRVIELTKSTRIPFKTVAEMTPGKGKPKTIGGVLHSEGRFFYDLQMMVSYQHDERMKDLIPAPRKMPARSIKKLRENKPFKVVALGDSITQGYNASGFKRSKAPRNQAPYVGLVSKALELRFKTPVTAKNLAVAGKTASWGLKMAGKVKQENPDLVILAFGMNDRVSPEQFQITIRQMVEVVQKDSPDADIVLVSPMIDNPNARKNGRVLKLRDALHQIDLPNVVHADVTTPWRKLLERKHFSDLSGNNINHPNDFGHRLYAQVIGALFESQSNGQVSVMEPDRALPKVLIMGDSISIGYTPQVKNLLQGKAEVIHHKGNAGPTIRGLTGIDQWLGDSQWDLIHFNFGLWDMYGWEYVKEDRSPAIYEKRLESLVLRLKKTGAKLIWATTTPACPEPEVTMKRRFSSDVVIAPALEQQYLDAALRVMVKHKIQVNDLHALVKPELKKHAIAPNNVHFTPDGRKKLAKQVAETIEVEIGKTVK